MADERRDRLVEVGGRGGQPGADRLSALGYELACGPELEFYLRNEIERYVTDWEFREYAYHL